MAYPPVFTEVLSTQIARYTGLDRGVVLAKLRDAGDQLPDRVVDLMFANARARLGNDPDAQRAAAERLEETRSGLIDGLGISATTQAMALATRRGELPPRPVARETADVAAEAPVHASWAEFELDLDRFAGSFDAATGARIRDYVTSSGPLPGPTVHDDFASTERRLRDDLRDHLARLGSAGEGTAAVAVPYARANAESVFARAFAQVQPTAAALGEPYALAFARDRHIEAVIATAGLPPGRLEQQTVAGWLDEADSLAGQIRDDPGRRDEHVTAFAEQVDHDLRWAAGDREAEPARRGVMSGDESNTTIREGIAVAVARDALPAVLERLPVPAELAGAGSVALPERFEARVAAAFAGSLAERTGGSQAEVLAALHAAGDDRDGTPQFAAATRLLVPPEQREAARSANGPQPHFRVMWAMEDQFRELYRNHDNALGISAEAIGTGAVDAGLRKAEFWGIGPADAPSTAEQPDPALQATVDLALPRDARRDAGRDVQAGEAGDGHRSGHRPGPNQRKGGSQSL